MFNLLLNLLFGKQAFLKTGNCLASESGENLEFA